MNSTLHLILLLFNDINTRGTAAFGAHLTSEMVLIAVKKKFKIPTVPQVVLKLSQGHVNSKYVLSFEIGQREGGFYSGRTDRQSHPVPY